MNSIVKVIVAVFVIAGVGFISYQAVNNWHKKKLAGALNTQKAEHQQEISQLNARITELQSTLDEAKMKEVESRPEPPAEAIEDAFGQEAKVDNLGDQGGDCAKHTQQIKALFDYFDKQGYLAREDISGQFFPFFNDCMKSLAEKPPVLVAEMDDLFLLAKNVSHLYRALGLNRLKALKTLLEEEDDLLEPSFAVLYAWTTACRKSEAPPAELPQLKTLYEYAGFFLNTLGGRSYLLRRDSKVRMLVSYYSVLILDLANDEKLNSVGLDVRPHIDFIYADLSNQKGFLYRDRYLAKLDELRNKYSPQQ